MLDLDRRKLLQAGLAFAVPAGALSLLGAGEASAISDNKISTNGEEPRNAGKMMQIKYLEIVTSEVEKLCQQYTAIHGVKFGDPDPSLGNARTAKLDGDNMIAIRGPLRPDEAPVIRPYVLVENLEKAVAAAKDAGAKIAIPKMEIPGHGTIAIVIQGGIECGLWQD